VETDNIQPVTRVHLPNVRLLKAVWEDAGLKHVKGSRLLVLVALVQHTSRNTDAVWPGIRRLADFTRLSPRQVLRVLEELERGGVIERDKRGRGRIYRMGPAVQSAVARIGDARDTYAEPIGDTGDMPQVTPATEIGDTDVTPRNKERDKEVSTAGDGDLLSRCKALFRMRPGTKLDRAQRRAWAEAAALVADTSEPQWQALEAHYAAQILEKDYRRQDLATLLNHWNGEITRAENWCRQNGRTFAQDSPRVAAPPAEWEQLVRVWQLHNYPDDEPRTFDAWLSVPNWMRDGVSGMVRRIEDNPEPEGWAAVIAALRDAGELPAGAAFAAWTAVPLWLRAQVHLLLEQSAKETDKQGDKE
jgi:DNA-binding MarR family transcriptional regulator